MRYVEARLDEYLRDKTYRIYITRSLQLIPQSKYITANYTDLIEPKEEDTRTGDEIALDIINRAGLIVGG